MKILYSGGGTLGSVSPLIAVHQKLSSEKNYQALWLGTSSGPEKSLVAKQNIPFQSIASGKFRRYFDFKNILDIFKILVGLWQAFFIILKFQPQIILTSGSFVSVPVVWAAWALGKPVFIHQQDIRVGLANKLMLPFATKITVALEKSLADFPKNKTVLVGNPLRQEAFQIKPSQLDKFNLNKDLPLVLVMGGGTGALSLNKIVADSLDGLTKICQVVHLTGKEKNETNKDYSNYFPLEFVTDEIFALIKSANLVISRAGMSTVTELAYFSKPTIFVPLPNSHQEKNAEYFAEKKASIYLSQEDLTPEKITEEIHALLLDKEKLAQLGENLHKIFVDYSGDKFVSLIKQIIK